MQNSIALVESDDRREEECRLASLGPLRTKTESESGCSIERSDGIAKMKIMSSLIALDDLISALQVNNLRRNAISREFPLNSLY